ncbi:MAG: electron transfer flavoprotein subunit alpha/FixB family protein [Kiritimatiellae bacterium]|nr:electron transfer flavoprotein subunit alpha/FixB family protein [Kiritimatiellia bacterium]
MRRVLVFAEVVDGSFNEVSLQCLTAGRTLAGPDGEVEALLIGANVGAHAGRLAAGGADRVTVVEDARLSAYTTEPWLAVACARFAAAPASAALLPASTLGNDLGPAIAAAIGAACVVDADGVALENGRPVAWRIGFDRKVRTTWAAEGARPLVATLRDGAAPPPDAGAARAATHEKGSLDDALAHAGAKPATRVVRRDVTARTVNLRDAKVIVAAGAGVGSPEGVELVQRLAAALGGEVGATRAVVDAGWLSADRQIGQTGATVRPDLYIACGISGAIQHRVGMLDSRTVIAINTDPNAPIFRSAHYRIVGDLKVVIPKLLKLLS